MHVLGLTGRTRGFTLVEVLVAMAILAIGVSALVSASGASAHRSHARRAGYRHNQHRSGNDEPNLVCAHANEKRRPGFASTGY